MRQLAYDLDLQRKTEAGRELLLLDAIETGKLTRPFGRGRGGAGKRLFLDRRNHQIFCGMLG